MPKISDGTSYPRIAPIAVGDKVYVVGTPGATPASKTIPVEDLFGYGLPGYTGMRLTLESGVPVSTTDQIAKSTVYCTPYKNNVLTVHDGTRWVQFQMAEISRALSGLTTGKLHDVVTYIKAGVPVLDLVPAWTNDSTRAVAKTRFSGAEVMASTFTSVFNGDSVVTPLARYLGTMRATAAGATEFSAANRFLWNAENQVEIGLLKELTGATHAYSTNTNRYFNADTTQHFDFVIGEPTTLHVTYFGDLLPGAVARYGRMGFGLDWTSGAIELTHIQNSSASELSMGASRVYHALAAGYHYVASLEHSLSSNSITFVEYSMTGRLLG